jgi:sugar/nucleoside kinase (ribokinase family)
MTRQATIMTDDRSHLSLSVAIIGDVFADLLCFLGDSEVPKPGGDVRLVRPIRTVAGGSGLNTATHLSSLLGRARGRASSTGINTSSGGTAAAVAASASADVRLHTVLNESDEYGRLLRSHAGQHGFDLVNCRRDDNNNDACSGSDSSTGHCTVIVSRGERSFMTHLGCVAAFEAHHVDVDGVLGKHNALSSNDNGSCSGSSGGDDHLHIHVAGYYNIGGFFDGRLKRLLQSILDRRSCATGNTSRGGGTTISLVPQHDATETWDGGLLDVLPLVDYLICSELEAECIANAGSATSDCEGGNSTGISSNDIQQLASFFHRTSPTTCVVVTLGSKGAVAFKYGEIVCRQKAPVDISDPVDPTGAGDAFAAGFLYGIHRHCAAAESEVTDDSLLRNGLFHGCLLGTSCVMKEGASTPASSDEIETLIQMSSAAGGKMI